MNEKTKQAKKADAVEFFLWAMSFQCEHLYFGGVWFLMGEDEQYTTEQIYDLWVSRGKPKVKS